MHWNEVKSDLKHKHIFGGNLSKIKLTNQQKLFKMAKNKQSNLIASVKTAEHRFYQQIYSGLPQKLQNQIPGLF